MDLAWWSEQDVDQDGPLELGFMWFYKVLRVPWLRADFEGVEVSGSAGQELCGSYFWCAHGRAKSKSK